MIFSRLVTFGCSLTFGDNLDDNYPDNYFPSEYAWPTYLAKLLNVPVVNNSKSGSSNKEILYTILNYDFKSDDIVFVLWTHHDRDCLILNENKIDPLGAWMDNKGARIFFKYLWNRHDKKTEGYFFYNYAHLYLQEKNIKHVFLIHEEEYIDLNLKWNLVKFLDVFFINIRNLYPPAKDGIHPGIEAHKIFAEKIYHKYNAGDKI